MMPLICAILGLRCSITPFDKTDLFDLDVKQDRRLVGPGVHIFQLISAGIHFQATTLIESTWANLTFSWEKKNKKETESNFEVRVHRHQRIGLEFYGGDCV